MKTPTKEEQYGALIKAPKPLRDFIVSPTLLQIYGGIERKHKFTPAQMLTVSQLANLTLLGFESETALETNIHQILPDLSHTTTVELVADIHTRVFKEAQRRVEESILEPSAYSKALEESAAPADPEYTRINNLDEDTPEWREMIGKKIEEQKAERMAFQKQYEEKVREQASASENADVEGVDIADLDEDNWLKSRYELELEAIESAFQEKVAVLENGEGAPAARTISAVQGGRDGAYEKPDKLTLNVVQITQPVPAEAPASSVSIAQQKLSVPTAEQSSTSQVESVLGQPGISSVELPVPLDSTTQKANVTPIQKRPEKSNDPYRESVD
ncbi:hypothetical protein K2P56_04010 [Patescibacteria group bacterium]|nr:hypothetical protein [Patescibacteria group bacterium]